LHVSPRFLFGKFFDRKGKKVAEKNKDVSDTPTKEENQETQNVENTSLASKSAAKKGQKVKTKHKKPTQEQPNSGSKKSEPQTSAQNQGGKQEGKGQSSLLEEFSRWLQMQYKIKERQRLEQWNISTRNLHVGPNRTWVRQKQAELTVLPTGQKFFSTWEPNERAAKRAVARRVLDHGKSPRLVLNEAMMKLLRRRLKESDVSINATRKGKQVQAEVRLFPELQGTLGLPEVAFTAEGADQPEAISSACKEALYYLLKSLAVMPLLKVIQVANGSTKARKQKPEDTTTTIKLRNIAPDVSESDLKAQLVKYGKVQSVELHHKTDSPASGHGSATFSSHMSAAFAARMLHGELVHGRPLCIQLDSPDEQKPKSYEPIIIKNGAVSKQAVKLYYKNAPAEISPQKLFDTLQEFGSISAFAYYRSKKTGAFTQTGTIQYNDPEIANKALVTLNGLEIEGNTLKVKEYQPPSKKKS